LERQRGEAIRLIDLPALDEGMDHIFDRAPKKLSVGRMIDWKRQQFAEIAQACDENHGAAYRRYISSLIAMGPRLDSVVRREVEYFIHKVGDGQDTDLSRDIAKRFALLYAGGILAIRAGVVGWEKKELFASIKKCYLKARALLPDDGELLRSGLDILKQKLATLPSIQTRNASHVYKRRCESLDGFKKAGNGNAHIIKRNVFDGLFVSRHQQGLIETWLLDNGKLTRALAKGANSNIAIPKEQHIWPDGERRRSIEICGLTPNNRNYLRARKN
jgi:hypothetical protein